MNSSEYRAEIAALGLSQVGAAVLGISERTSRRYAANGVPEKHAAWLKERMKAYAAKLTKENGEWRIER